ncbi:hypothetical protein BS50DRAFT_185822 [Corynespora cassiicola Philippines]|uniref:Uncharacterized protein n=1 Tax=Corynespora cassiicola Philippines TaxID=1448308 RepID=A0A2T2P6Z0_CORCC|nr:hypothetical protein BS50DRAFT_185822 [Corynespora cassiicola Philippines]
MCQLGARPGGAESRVGPGNGILRIGRATRRKGQFLGWQFGAQEDDQRAWEFMQGQLCCRDIPGTRRRQRAAETDVPTSQRLRQGRRSIFQEYQRRRTGPGCPDMVCCYCCCCH